MLNVASFTIERSKYEAGVFIVFVVLKVVVCDINVVVVADLMLYNFTLTSMSL
jgi:hypothetical protein